MADRDNLHFFSKVLDGIGYGKLCKTNRAYSFMRSNNVSKGPCLNFLKDNITDENIVTVSDMNLFMCVQKQTKIPSFSEIDAELAKYLSDSENDLQHIHTSALHDENSRPKFYEALESEERMLKRLCNDFQKELNTLEFHRKRNCKKRDGIQDSVLRTNTLNNNIFEEVQNELAKITRPLSDILHNSSTVEERDLFRMNLAIFKKINVTFREVVNVAIREHFHNVEYESLDGCSTAVALDEASANLVLNVGLCNYQKLKLRCEVAELEEVKEYVEDMAKELHSINVDLTRLRLFTNEDMEITDQIQKKMKNLTESLEKFHRNYVVKKMLISYRKQFKRKMKSDARFLRKISECSAKFVDLMTLQAHFSRKEKKNLHAAVAVCRRGKQKLEYNTEKHLMTLSNLQKITVDDKFSKDSKFRNSRISQAPMNALADHNPINVMRNKLLSFVFHCLRNYSVIKEQFKELNGIVYCGPTGQIFFYSGLRNDIIFIKQKYNQYNQRYNLSKSQHDEITEKTLNECGQLEKTFGLLFLTNTVDLRCKLEQLRTTVLENKSKSSKTLISTLSVPDFPQFGSWKGNKSSII